MVRYFRENQEIIFGKFFEVASMDRFGLKGSGIGFEQLKKHS
jgi:hypothetical protein